jgi:RNA-splicing ligase RtcB
LDQDDIDVSASPEDVENFYKIRQHMEEIAKIPTVQAISVMPDACPAGSALGTIPVGGVVVTKNAIHPGMHSADACCSMALSVLNGDQDPKALLDSAMRNTHFGMGGRDDFAAQPSDALMSAFEGNRYLVGLIPAARKHFGTQGDGNHFWSLGRLESTGQTCIVTHHGSRKPGAELYKKGLADAWEATRKVCPEVGKHNSWLDFDTENGQEYWKALQLIRRWTRENHFAIHDSVIKDCGARLSDRTFNEHNFVFKRGEFFIHAKGATPSYKGFSDETSGRVIIPLNMAAPILICDVNENPNFGTDFVNTPSLGFCPHGAGRTLSRTEFQKRLESKGLTPKGMIEDYTSKFDIRAFSGKYDISEFPEAYKPEGDILTAIKKYNLTVIVDRVMPYGSIMAGHSGWDRRRDGKSGKQV